MASGLNEFNEQEHIRPTLLTALCILTFIGSSWLILSNIYSYTVADKTAQMISTVRNAERNDSAKNADTLKRQQVHQKRIFFGANMMSSVSKAMTPDNIRKSAIGTIVSSLLTLFGAILMWRLKRTGFFIYILGTLVALALPFYLYGSNMMSVGMASFSGFFGLLFIALYVLNIKSLR
jgi:hypothetical protein